MGFFDRKDLSFKGEEIILYTRMKRTILFSLLIIIPILVFAGTIFQETGGQGNQVTWKTADETGVSHFVVARSEWQREDWGPEEVVATVNAKGSGSTYLVEDTRIFKTADRTLRYEIKAVNSQGAVLEIGKPPLRIAGVTSAAKRTWGSIKAMFR